MKNVAYAFIESDIQNTLQKRNTNLHIISLWTQHILFAYAYDFRAYENNS